MLSWKKDQLTLNQAPIVKVPLQFLFEPVQILSKELTKLNSPYQYRIHYLGPRWDDSAILHKKYSKKHGYKYNEKQINNNSNFFSESMSKNQFYRNQIYYRAFEGMNPTIQKQQQLSFNSRFQSGNLDCVVKVSDNQYDLFLRTDSNTKGHLSWFYFQISNAKKDNKIRLNLCNLTKSKTLYQKGFKPYTCIQSQKGQYVNWTQQKIQKIRLQPKKLRYAFIYEKIKVRTLYQLSFYFKFTSNKPVRFAYCIPYTYTKLLKQINCLGQSTQVGWLGKSLTGLDIPLIKIGNFQQDIDKPVVFMIGRLHPGQSNGSITLSGVMKHLCLSKQAQYLRKKVITIIVPMINPDGVILGNSRTGAAGKDLNRQFKTKNRHLFPQVELVKKLVWNIQQTHDIQIFLDFHGHSRKKNMFLFGPNYNLTQPQYYKSRVIPKFLSSLTSIFRYFGCNYSIPPCKLTTARAVMINELGIPFVYTVQTSVGLYHDHQLHKDLPFTQAKYQQIGINVCKALKLYFESIQQYEEFLRSRNAQQQHAKKVIKAEKVQKVEKIEKYEKLKHLQNKVKKLSAKQVKLFKLYEQIKIQESKISKKRQQFSDADSDSQNGQQNLQKLKMAQFQGMVTQCIQVQKKRKQKTDQLLGRKKQKTPSPSKRFQRKTRNISHKEELNIINQILVNQKQVRQNSRNDRNDQIFVIRDERKANNRKNKSIDNKQIKKTQQQIVLKKFQKVQQIQKDKSIQFQNYLSKNHYFDVQHRQLRTKSNKAKLKMFNFSKMMVSYDQEKRTISSSSRYRNQLGRGNKKNNISSLNGSLQPNSSQINKPMQIKTVDRKYWNMSFNDNLQKIEEDQGQLMNKKQEKNRSKGVYPAPFYRIKYQSYHRKKLKSLQYHLKQQYESSEYIQPQPIKKKKKHDLFLKIKKFQS